VAQDLSHRDVIIDDIVASFFPSVAWITFPLLPIMATAARTTVVQVDEIVEVGALDPEAVVTPGIFVNRVVAVGERPWLRDGEFVGGVDLAGAPLAGAGASAGGAS